MANSIARLAILMTADTSGLSAGMARSQQIVKGFGTNINNAGKGASLLMNSFTKGAGLLAVTALFTTLIRRTSDASSAMTDLETNTVRAFQQSKAALGEFHGSFVSSADTWKERIDGLNASLGQFARTAGKSTNTQNPFKELTSFSGRRLDEFTKLFGGETGGEFQKRMAGIAAETKSADERLKEYAKAAEQASESHRKFIESLKERAGNLVESLRTPAEIFADTIREIQQLSEFGLLDTEQATRGILRAKKELLDATKIAKEFRSVSDVRVGAVSRDTVAGFSAVQSGRAELLRLAELAKQELEEDKRQTKAIADVEKAIKNKKPVTFMRSSL